MKVDSVMVTGANRGIGLEFVRQLSQMSEPPRYIFATYRNADSLQDLKEIEQASTKSKMILIKMDVRFPEEIEAAKAIVEGTVGDRGLNLLINNAGIAQMEMFPNITPENLELHYKVNTEGPILVLQAMLPSLERAAQEQGGSGMSASKAAVLNMTSMAGSITNAGVVFTQDLAVPSYKISKAALNMAMRVAAAKVKEKGVLVVMMCPGWVKTDMGGRERAVLRPEESIADMLRTLGTLDESHQGVFMDRLGNPYPF